MNRPVLVCALWVAAAMSLAAQSSQSNPYSGTSNPPPDDTISDNAPPPTPAAKPPAVHYTQPAAPAQPLPARNQAQPAQSAPAESFTGGPNQDSGDDDMVHVAPAQPTLNTRAEASDPDGDIVHPAPLPAGELGAGTEIRVRLLDSLSSAESQAGEPFRTRVASDVFRGNDILIPAGAEIDGTVVQVSSGHTGGHGSMLLRPETVILPDGARYHLYAQLMGAPGSNTRVSSEGSVSPDSRLKKDGIEYGGAVGAGAVTGAVLGGPAGALAGTLIGAGAVTVHLLSDHPQARLDSGTVLLFTLTEPLSLVGSGQQALSALPAASSQQAPDAQPPADTRADTGAQPTGGAVSQN
jgi:hypothetical protein